MKLTPYSRINNVLEGKEIDRIPFTVYWLMFPRGEAERKLRNEGVAIVERVPLYHIEYPNIELISREYFENGKRLINKEYHTPVGTVSSLFTKESTNDTSWWQSDYYIKKTEDYRIMEYIIDNMIYVPDFQAFSLTVKRYGEDGYVIGNTEYSPMNRLIYDLIGMERFCFDLLDNKEKLLSLYRLIWNRQKDMFKICEESPAKVISYGGNISQEVIGADRFKQYYLPCLNEFADVMHKNNKLASCHYDAKMSSLVELVAASRTDIIEAFTPFPTGDLSLADVREVWKDKVIWINFPSSVFVESEERILYELCRILKDAGSDIRFLIGITEDVPEENWRRSFHTINTKLRDKGQLLRNI